MGLGDQGVWRAEMPGLETGDYGSRVSPLKHANLSCLGPYSFATRPPRKGLRPLRDPATGHLDEDEGGTGE
ncbi:hypothetical protein GCM10022403_004540 [Streptomyces coacervatus]|uniref:Uncharacterized protein n=2 Tax=Streptomyces coacervatus TaxID=647381 RepID=A0ABP7GRM2_9ACTN